MNLDFPNRIRLARLETPVQRLPGLSDQLGKNLWIWRDDLTGWELSGNKIRKLEFLCAEARSLGADHLVTCGGPQSNHARATAFAARTLGLDITVVVREPQGGMNHDTVPSGNLLLNRILGVNFTFVAFDEFQREGGVYDPFLDRAARQIEQGGGRPYVIPEGGSCPTGCWGYLSAVNELTTRLGERPFDLFCAVGSGGTFAGLELGRSLLGTSMRLHGVNVCDSAEYFQRRIGRMLEETVEKYRGNGIDYSQGNLNIHDGFVGGGYAIASDDDLAYYAKLARETGILLDPVYTGKAFQGMLNHLQQRPGDFHDNIVFLHSGGQFASFAFAEQYSRVIA